MNNTTSENVGVLVSFIRSVEGAVGTILRSTNVINVLTNGPGNRSGHSETSVLWCRLVGRSKVVCINFVSIFGKIGLEISPANWSKVL